MKIRAILSSLDADRWLDGHLTTESAASSYGLAVFEHANDDPADYSKTMTLNRGDLVGEWALYVAAADADEARRQPAWRDLVRVHRMPDTQEEGP